MSVKYIYYHVTFSPQYREKILDELRLKKIITHIREYAKTKNIYIFAINGYRDHIHILASIPVVISISEALKCIKGESSHWINSSHLYRGRFRWQKDYYIETVSRRDLGRLIKYINNQYEHHRKLTFNPGFLTRDEKMAENKKADLSPGI
jgi:putative transposase